MKIQPSQLNASIRDIPLPDNMNRLPVSAKGFPVPHFVARQTAPDWDFRVVNPQTVFDCVKQKRCWLCGQSLGTLFAFVTGPMCVVTKTSSEPPSHYSCAKYAAVACPFLANPRMKRNEADMPEGHTPPPGIAVMRNPGVTAVLLTRKYTTFPAGDGGMLIQMGRPTRVEWYAERRAATRAEVLGSIESGLPALVEQCEQELPQNRNDAKRELARYLNEAMEFMPPAGGAVPG
jgi:hypothetical protein